MIKETKVVDNKEVENEEKQAAPVESQDQESKEETTEVTEVKHTIFGKVDQWIIDRRTKKAKAKAEKKPMSKAQKAAIAGGITAAAIGGLGLAGKALLRSAAKYAEDDQETDDDTEDYGYPSEDDFEPADAELDTSETTSEET